MDLLTRHRQGFLVDLQWSCTGNTLYQLLKFEDMNSKKGIKALFGTCSKECETEEDPEEPSARPHSSRSTNFSMKPLSPLRYSTNQPKSPSEIVTRNLVFRRNNFQSKQAASVVGRDLPDSRTHPLATWVLGSSAQQVRRSTTYLP